MAQPKTKAETSIRLLCLTIIINFLIMVALFYLFGRYRNVDGDEGLYLEAARLITHGKRLYFDFFYQQMPVIPYLYAAWMKLFGFDLLPGRYLSVTLTSLTGLGVLIYVAKTTRNLLLVNIIALLFYSSGLILAWAPVIKTHPFSMFTLTISCLLLLEWRNNQKAWILSLVAFIIGIGVNARLTLGPILICYFIFILLNSRRNKWIDSLNLVLVVSLTSIPTFLYFFSDPQLFIQYNLTYHTKVYPGVVDVTRRLQTAGNLINERQIFILLLVVQLGAIITLAKGAKVFFKSDEGFIFILLAVFFMIHMASAEPFTQYFVAMVPLSLLLFIPVFKQFRLTPKLIAIPLLGLFLFVYVSQGRASMDFEITSMRSHRAEWSMAKIQKTADRLKKIANSGEYCLAWWPGYAVMAGCRSVPGMENHMRNYAVLRLLKNNLESYKFLPDETLLKALQQEKYRVVVDDLFVLESPYYSEIKTAIDEHYWSVGDGVKVLSPTWFRGSLEIFRIPPQGNAKN